MIDEKDRWVRRYGLGSGVIQLALAAIVSLLVAGCSDSSDSTHEGRNVQQTDLATSVPGVVVQADNEQIQGAETAARAWLNLLDVGEYTLSWRESSPLFQLAITETNWQRTAASVRTPLGDVVSRNLQEATFATTLPGAPDGEYVVIQFSSSFQNKRSATETVTPMLTEKGEWRVAGYFIK